MLDFTLPFEIAAVLLLFVVFVAVAFLARRAYLTREVGSFDCSVRESPRGWRVGIARYGPNRVEWYRVFGIGLSPNLVLRRGELELLGRRDLEPGEADTVMPGDVVVRCRHRGREIELALSFDAYTGLASWSEAGPPGQQWTTS